MDPNEIPQDVVDAALKAYHEGLSVYTIIDGPNFSNKNIVTELRMRDALAAAFNRKQLNDYGGYPESMGGY